MELQDHCGKLLVARWDPLELDETCSAGVRQPWAHSQHTFTDHINHQIIKYLQSWVGPLLSKVSRHRRDFF